jgi:hypothetical protein
MRPPILILGMLSCSYSLCAGDSWGADSLRGVKPFHIALTMGACSDDLSTKTIYDDVVRDIEVKLRVARIPVDPKANLPVLNLTRISHRS